MNLCTQFEARARMSDAEFWETVFPHRMPDNWDTEPSVIDQEDMVAMSHLANPCPECGQWGACAYDSEGRAMIHVVNDDDT